MESREVEGVVPMLTGYQKGQRVIPSEKGVPVLSFSSRGKNAGKQRIGTVVGRGRSHDCVTVVWDGNRPTSKHLIHRTFLDPAIIDSNGPATEDRIPL